jgi:hypothetical protein
VDVDPVERSRRGQIPQPFEARADKRGTTVAIIDAAVLGRELQPVCQHPRLQSGKLAGNGALANLLFGGDPGVDGDAQGMLHGYCLLIGNEGRHVASARQSRLPPD